jgi:hypothetical protein
MADEIATELLRPEAAEYMDDLIREARARRLGARRWQLGEQDSKETSAQIRRARAESTRTVDLGDVRSAETREHT